MKFGLEQFLTNPTRGLEAAREALRQSEQMLAVEVTAAQQLQHAATQLITARGTQALFEQILDTAQSLLRSDFASIQMFYPERGIGGELLLLSLRGFGAEQAQRWKWVNASTRTTCGEALRTGRRVVVSDVRTCDFMAGSDELEEFLAVGVRSAQTLPLISRSAELLGMVTTYWREPHELSPTESRSLDVLARLAADLIERSRTEDRLRDSEAHLKNAERISHVGHWQWDLQSNRVSGSEEMYRIFGKPPDYVPNYRAFLDDVTPSDRERVRQLMDDSLANKIGHSIEFQICLPNGDLRAISSIWEVLLDEDGSAARVFGTCQDITESRRAQEESFARQKLESVGTLASGIAHDFNNLLGGVMALAEFGLEELGEELSPVGELEAIRQAAVRGSEVVRELLMYAGNEQEVCGLIHVSQVVGNMLELLKVSVSKHATLQFDLAEQLPAIRASAAQVSQLAMNLVTNASEAIGDRGGVIRVTARRVVVGRTSPETRHLPQGDYVRLEITDSGCGMSAATRARVFDPFFSTKAIGRGLGLAVVRGIVRDLGGSIHLVSEPGYGTTFQILLPRAEAAPQTAYERISDIGKPVRTSPSLTVLIVEDEGPLRLAVSKMLGKQGFSVIEAGDGSAALEAIRGRPTPVHVLLLDVTLPGLSSRELLEEARRLRPDMSLIVASACTEEMASALLQSRIERFIRKPYRLDELVQLIRQIPPEPLLAKLGHA